MNKGREAGVQRQNTKVVKVRENAGWKGGLTGGRCLNMLDRSCLWRVRLRKQITMGDAENPAGGGGSAAEVENQIPNRRATSGHWDVLQWHSNPPAHGNPLTPLWGF